jgi:putative hydrolase of the HAD superfamily
MIQVVGFDGDDTLWHNEGIFTMTQQRFAEVLAPHLDGDPLERLAGFERRNLEIFGYGIKGFTLSMVETAIEVTGGRVSADEIGQILAFGKEMLEHPVELLPGAAEAVEEIGRRRRVVLITKGDLFDQETKVARSGLGEHFDSVEVVSEKNEDTYERVLRRLDVDTKAFCMVGNSLRSDVVPVARLGGCGVHVPYDVTWAHEQVGLSDLEGVSYHTLASLRELPHLLDSL